MTARAAVSKSLSIATPVENSAELIDKWEAGDEDNTTMSALYTAGKRGNDQVGEQGEGFRLKVGTADLRERFCGDGGVASLARHGWGHVDVHKCIATKRYSMISMISLSVLRKGTLERNPTTHIAHILLDFRHKSFVYLKCAEWFGA